MYLSATGERVYLRRCRIIVILKELNEELIYIDNGGMKIQKWYIMFLFLMLVSSQGYGQTQQGYVKTQGRPNNPGVPLSGVTIRVRGTMKSVLSGADGRFSFLIPDKKDGDAIVLQQVRKQGYELCDRELMGRQLVFSTHVPIEIVMVNSEDLAANKRRIEQKAYQVAERNYQNRLKQLDQQLKQQAINAEQYRKELQELQDRYEKYQMLISNMAERYARTDYDHLDSIDIVINQCIENGELERADSLIHTVFDPNTVLERNRAAKAEIQERMQLAQEIIDKANADKEAIRRDSAYAKRVIILCDNLATEYLSQGEQKKANECLQQSLSIRLILYGEESDEVKEVKQKIEGIK